MHKTYEERLREGLSRQDAVMYARACLGLGTEGEEDPVLFETGLELIALEEKENKKLSKLREGLEAVTQSSPTPQQPQERVFHSEAEKYEAFLHETRDKNIDTEAWGKHYDAKVKLLKDYFPSRFGKGARQDLDAKKYEAKSLGYIFHQLFKEAKKYNGK